MVRNISGKLMHPEIMTRNGLRVVDIVNGVCQNAQAREDEVQITAGDTILSRDDCVAHTRPGKSLELSMAVVPGAPLTAQATNGKARCKFFIILARGFPMC